MEQTQLLEIQIPHEREGTFFQVPVTIPEGIESLCLRYQYPRFAEEQRSYGAATFTARKEINIVDLGLIGPDSSQVGASGSDKEEIFVSEVSATPGYRPTPLIPGEWGILVGAYKIAPEGVTVRYELEFQIKQSRWLRGDLHAHTLASDGVLTTQELAQRALRHGLDFVAITDHNQPVSRDSLPQVPGLTVIPGLEWTHYRGHANFLGIDQPYDEPFAANTPDEIQQRFASARQRGALITVNHPFDDCCSFLFDPDSLPYDCLEVWNGPMRETNLKAIAYWQSLLAAGRKVPIVGGSDYHRDTPFIFLGGPTTCVYAQSAGQSDILAALRAGHAYLTFAPNGPWLEMFAGEAIPGDTVCWSEVKEIQVKAGGLIAGDILRVVTARDTEVLIQAPDPGKVEATYTLPAPSGGPLFARVEILRAFLPGLPHLPALISNPIYFEP